MEEEQRSSFWSTVPGILTGVAAVISAATGGYLAFNRMSSASVSNSAQTTSAAELKPAAAVAATPGQPFTSRTPTASAATASESSNSQAPAPAAVMGGQPSTSQTSAAIVDADVTANPLVARRRPVASGQPRPSFDCARASTRVEDMVCTDTDLAARDRRAAALYFELRNSLPPELRIQLLQSQKRFLHERSDCSTSECLSDLYDVRLRQLAEFDSSQR